MKNLLSYHEIMMSIVSDAPYIHSTHLGAHIKLVMHGNDRNKSFNIWGLQKKRERDNETVCLVSEILDGYMMEVETC